MKGKDLQARLLYPAKIPFRTEGQIKSFPDKNVDRIIDTGNVLMVAGWMGGV